MAKKGLDAFLLDTTLDSDVELIRSKFGNAGLLALIMLWQKCYRENGYYIVWDDDTASLFCTRELHWERSKLDGVVRECLRRGLFSSEKYKQFGVLTSSQIQKRYLKARSRSSVEIEKNLLLLQNPEKCCKNLKIVTKKYKNVTIQKRREEKRREEKDDDNIRKLFEKYRKIYSELYGNEKKLKPVETLIKTVIDSLEDDIKEFALSKNNLLAIYQVALRMINPFDDEIFPLNVLNQEGYLKTTITNLYLSEGEDGT